MKPEEKIYQAYFESKKNSLYFNEIKELSKLADSSLTTTLNRLTENNTIVHFGSASRKEERKESDIDLLVVSNKLSLANNKKEAEITSKHSLSMFQTTVEQFIQNKDDVIIQARKTGFPIYKEQNFYEAV